MNQPTQSHDNSRQSPLKSDQVFQPWSAPAQRRSDDHVGHHFSLSMVGSRLIPDASGNPIETVCEQILRNVCTLSGASVGALMLLPVHAWEPVMHIVTDPALTRDVRFQYCPGTGWPGWILHHRQALLIPDCSDRVALARITPGWSWHGWYTEGLVTCREYSQYLGAALTVEEDVIGVLGLLRRHQDRPFMGVDRQSLQGMATRVAVARERLRSRREREALTAALHVLAELHALNAQGASPSKMCQVALFQGLSALGCEAGHIRLKQGNRLVLTAAAGYVAHLPSTVRLLGQGLSGWAAAHQRALYIGRTATQRTACLPLIADGHIVGTLVVRKRRGAGFTDAQTCWLTSIAAILATAIKRSWVLPEAEACFVSQNLSYALRAVGPVL